MGKGKGKAGRKEAKLAAKKANEAPKIPGIPKPPKPIKKAKKIPSREKKSAINTNPPGPADFPIPMGRPKPFTKSPQHAKWPALFKKSLGVIEAHIRNLDRVMQSMKADMQFMGEKERLEFELGERGNWRVICGMMDRAREILATEREAARGILPSRALRDKKGLGVAGTNFEPLGPQLAKKAEALGYDPKGKGQLGRDPDGNPATVDEDGDSEMSDASDATDSDSDSDSGSESNAEDKVAGGADFVSLNVGSNIPLFGENKESKSTANDMDPSPLFFVDTTGTPVNISAVTGKILTKSQQKKEKKIQLAEARKAKKQKRIDEKAARIAAARAAEGPGKNNQRKRQATVENESESESESAAKPAQKATPAPMPEPTIPDVDFVALEASLKAEVAKAEAAKVKRDKKDKKDKKRRRSSGADADLEIVEKKVKKEEKEKEKKRKADESESAVDEADGGKKKKRKHKVDA